MTRTFRRLLSPGLGLLPGLGLPLGLAAGLMGVLLAAPAPAPPVKGFGPGARVLLDAHNCYPYEGKWADRITRALGTGTPLAIEQDLVWFKDPVTGKGRSLVAHEPPYSGKEPTLKSYFFDHVRPVVLRALEQNRRDTWPVIVLNLDLKSNEPEHHAEIWKTLGEYESWLTTAPKSADPARVMPLDVKPILVLTGSPDSQEQSFSTSLPAHARLRVFGAIRVDPPPQYGKGQELLDKLVDIPPNETVPSGATNYRRWANYPWAVVERGGQQKSEAWTAADRERLRSLVDRAHSLGLWIRFYTLNGHASVENKGWTDSYNFGSETAVRARWQAAVSAGVDFVATDQYEGFAETLKTQTTPAMR
jgi:hypothetical protein